MTAVAFERFGGGGHIHDESPLEFFDFSVFDTDGDDALLIHNLSSTPPEDALHALSTNDAAGSERDAAFLAYVRGLDYHTRDTEPPVLLSWDLLSDDLFDSPPPMPELLPKRRALTPPPPPPLPVRSKAARSKPSSVVVIGPPGSNAFVPEQLPERLRRAAPIAYVEKQRQPLPAVFFGARLSIPRPLLVFGGPAPAVASYPPPPVSAAAPIHLHTNSVLGYDIAVSADVDTWARRLRTAQSKKAERRRFLCMYAYEIDRIRTHWQVHYAADEPPSCAVCAVDIAIIFRWLCDSLGVETEIGRA